MISRRKARIKALQTLYMEQLYDQGHMVEDPSKLKDFYKKSLQQIVDELYTTLWYMQRIHDYAQEEYDIKSQKLSENTPTDESSLALTRLPFIQHIKENPYYQKRIQKIKPGDQDTPDLIRQLYRQYRNADITQAYLEGGEDAPTEADLLDYLLTQVMLPSAVFQDQIEERYNLWYDDETEVVHIIQRLLREGLDTSELSINSNILDLGLTLIDSVVSNKSYFDELIQPKLQNWDPKRIAPLSIIALYMGIAEFLHLPTIPTTVTINEYIDITKQYGAESNKQFVNAVLDKVKVQLEEEKLLKKQ